MKGVFVTGIGTGAGKTAVSAILVRALQAGYWKPVQSGDPDDSDSMKIRQWGAHPELVIYPERYRFKEALSPHAAAEAEGVVMKLDDFMLPQTSQTLVVEGAGGLLVPLNKSDLMIDLIAKTGLPAVLVSRHYLGSINHTLLSLEALKSRGIAIAGVVFNGDPLPQTEEAILSFGGVPVLFSLKEHKNLTADLIAQYAGQLSEKSREIFGQFYS